MRDVCRAALVLAWALVACTSDGRDTPGAATAAPAAGSTVSPSSNSTGANTTSSVASPMTVGVTTTATGATRPAERLVPAGTWGGPGAALTVTPGGGTVEFDCARGTIDQPLRLDGDGAFAVAGTYTVLRGGPPDPSQPRPEPRAAQYAGSTDGRQLQLIVTVPESGQNLGPFVLVLGQPALLSRCG